VEFILGIYQNKQKIKLHTKNTDVKIPSAAMFIYRVGQKNWTVFESLKLPYMLT